ncbi:sensor domain-containing diguanylate cyclase [Nitrosophilus kaiyonis]|uniref:sensor domain-containing diguanylate cyclase n=1 Tax=Nitrosophilus kaiyonis TaxID=2930200 RepID=UPI0024938FC2|nr:diguanylate cyclase [Nitrosophilus kaiyonis]
MEQFAHFTNSSITNSQNLGNSLLDEIRYFFQRLSFKRPPDSFTKNGQMTKKKTAPISKNELLNSEVFMEIFDFCNELIYIKDLNFRYIWFNNKFKKIFLEKVSDIKKIDDFDIFDYDFAYKLKKTERYVVLNKTPALFDYNYLDKFYHIKIVPIKKDNILIGIAGIIEDRTEFKRKVDDLLELNEYLKKRCTIFENLSMIDPLTQVYNKRKFNNILEKEIERAKRYNEPLSLILFDIDNFKNINDKYGHLTGDIVLKSIIDSVKSNIRKIDILSRIGGDEFAIIVPNTNIENSINLARKLNSDIEKIKIKNIKEKISCSFGVAEYKKNENFTDFFKRADNALYKSKKEGKNRISFIK